MRSNSRGPEEEEPLLGYLLPLLSTDLKHEKPVVRRA